MGFKGSRQQKCGICKQRCGFYCVECSCGSTPTSIKVVHPGTVRGIKYKCLETHRRDPGATRWCTPVPECGKKRKQKA